MPIKTKIVQESILKNVPQPNHGGRYAVVPHGYVIDQTKTELAKSGFTIKKEEYKASLDGQMAQGIYHLNYGNDADMGLMFAWGNSYNKMTRFKCAVGAHVFVCSNGVMRGDMGNYKRRHIGNHALNDVILSIQQQLAKSKEFYNLLIKDKELLKNVMLTSREKGRILGELYAKDEILTLTQVGIVKREMDKPSFNYNCDPDSAWAMYNHITYSLKESHPMTYLDDHQKVHEFFMDIYGQPTVATVVDEVVENDDNPIGVNFL